MKKYLKKPLFWSTIVLSVTTIFFGVAASGTAQELSKVEVALAKYNLYYDVASEDIFSYYSEDDSTTASSDTSSSSSTESTTYSSSSTKPTYYDIGTSLEFASGLIVKVNSITPDDGRELNDKDGGIPLVVSFTITNNGSDSWRLNVQHFSMLDGQNQVVNFDSSTYRTDFPNNLNVGQTVTGDIIFSAQNGGPYQISFGDATWSE